MNRRAVWVLFLPLFLTLLLLSETRSRAQNVEGQVIASEYGEYQVWGSGTNRFTFTPASCQVSGGGRNFAAFTRGTPVLIADPGDPSIDETVIAGLVDIQACSVQLSAVHKHFPPFYLTSGTGGLQEAINANLSSQGANTIILSAEWYRLGGSAATIASVSGNSSLRLEDITTTPATWYQWNGSQYVAVSGSSGVGSLNSLTGAVSLTPANSNVTVSQSGSNIQIGFSGAIGVNSINGDKSPTQSIVGTGGITCSTAAGMTTCNYAGTAGSGAIGSGGPYNESGYTPGTAGTTVGPESNSVTLPLNLTTTAIDNVLATQKIRVHIQPGDAHTPFTNGTMGNVGTPHFDQVVDDRNDVPVSAESLKVWGAQCDLRTFSGSLSGTTLTVGSNTLTSADIGKTVAGICDPVSGVPTVYEGTLASGSGTSWTVTANPSCVVTSGSANMEVGWDDTAAITRALSWQQVGSNSPVALSVPVGNCLTHVQTQAPLTLIGVSAAQSKITSFPGESIFAVSGGTNQVVSNFTLNIDNRIDATQSWQYIDATGTVNPVSGVYQPLLVRSAYANNPVAPGWFTGPGTNGGGAINGVAAVTSGSPTITVASASIPAVGQQIIFPYLSPIFSTTVSGVSGSTVTLGSNYPGATISQSEFFAGTSAQNITSLATTQCTLPCVIPASGRTFPMTLQVANTLVPAPGYESNIAGFGVVKIDGEEFTYDSINRSAAGTNSIVLTAGQQNGTPAAEHDATAVMVPLNPFKYDSAPWPVTPAIGGVNTPAGAEYYPAFNVGNFAYGTPWLDGSSGSVSGPYHGHFDNLLIQQWPLSNHGQNTTADFYFVGWPYSTYFTNSNLFGDYCFVEGQTGLNTHDASGLSGDATVTDNLSCHATTQGVAVVLTSGAQTAHSNWNIYGGGGSGVLSGGGFNVANNCDDQTGGCGSLSGATFSNIYNEPGGFAYGNAVGMETDCNRCTFTGLTYSGGGDVVLDGGPQSFIESHLGDSATYPTINFGGGNSFANTLAGSPSQSSVYGSSNFLNYGAATTGCIYSGSTPCIQTGVGSSGRPYSGQTADTFATGNITAPYVDPILGFATPENMSGFQQTSTFDPTAPITNHFVGCNLTGYLSNCGGGAALSVGPGQALAASSYVPYLAVKATIAATFVFSLHTTCYNTTIYSQTVSATTAWQVLALPTASFSGIATGCQLIYLMESQSTPTQVQIAFMDFQPVAQQVTAQAVNLNGPTIYSGSGAPSGCGTTYANGSLYLNTSGNAGSMLYTCIGNTWTDIK